MESMKLNKNYLANSHFVMSVLLAIGVLAQPSYAVEQMEGVDVNLDVVLADNVIDESLENGAFTSGGAYQDAMDLLEAMKKSEEGFLIEHRYKTPGEAWKVLQCLGYEILNGRSDLRIHTTSTCEYVIGWSNATEMFRQQEIATNYVNQIWSEHEQNITALSTQKEKADYIANILVNIYVKEYDRSYTNYTISDLVDTGIYKGTCMTFSTLMDRLCAKAGINCFMELGDFRNKGFHAWNKLVFDDGSVHYYDLTVYRSNRNEKWKDMSADCYASSYTPSTYSDDVGYGAGIPLIS